MGQFSTVLTKIMDRKSAINNDVIRYTGINRSTFFKVKSGKRNPSSPEMVEKIISALRLNSEDRRLLLEAYEIDHVGEYRYYGMKAIQELFMSEMRHSGMQPATISIPEFREGEHIRIFRESSEVRAAILAMLYEKSEKIMIMENRMSEAYTVGIPLASRANPETEFLHIFMMDDSNEVGINHQLYNVNCFRNVMEIMTKAVRYFPRYCYMPVALLEKNARQNNFILSDRYLLTYSDTCDGAVLYDDPALLKLYGDIFSEYVGRTEAFAESMDMTGLIREQIDFATSTDEKSEVYCFCPGICCSIMVDEDENLILDYIKDEFPGKDEFVRYYRTYRESFQQGLRELGETCHILCAANAVRNFAGTGYINEFPRYYAAGIGEATRPSVLKQWRLKSGAYNVRTLRGKCIPDVSSLSLMVSDRKAIITVINEDTMMNVQFCVREPSIAGLIYAYLEKLEHDCAMGKDEYDEFMEGLLLGMTG